MMKQNKTNLQFILAGALLLAISLTACNNGETKEVKENTTTTIVTPPPVVIVDSTDTMEKKPGKVAPGHDLPNQ